MISEGLQHEWRNKYHKRPDGDATVINMLLDELQRVQKARNGEPVPVLNNFERGLLEELIQSYNTIHFLYGCLEDPEHCQHKYPEQTRDRMDKIRGIVVRSMGWPKSCYHSNFNNGCPACSERLLFLGEHVFDKRLGW